MQTGRPSETARSIAHIRAKYSNRYPEILDDPLAARILCESVLNETVLDVGLSPEVVRHRGLYIIARARAAEDVIATAISAGTTQVVILGAGLDTTAYRNSHPAVRFFEVDHPDTQRWKRRQLRVSGITVPDTLRFVPVDFHQATLASELAHAGLDPTHSTVFVLLGVVAYLARTAVDETVRYIASVPSSQLVFDYFYPPATEQLQTRADSVARLGEPWKTFFTASEVHEILTRLGYHVQDRSASELLATHGVRTFARPVNSEPHLVQARTGRDHFPKLHGQLR